MGNQKETMKNSWLWSPQPWDDPRSWVNTLVPLGEHWLWDVHRPVYLTCFLHFSGVFKVQQKNGLLNPGFFRITSFFQGISRDRELTSAPACNKWGPLIFRWKSTNSSTISSRSSWGKPSGDETSLENLSIYFDDLPSYKAPCIEDFKNMAPIFPRIFTLIIYIYIHIGFSSQPCLMTPECTAAFWHFQPCLVPGRSKARNLRGDRIPWDGTDLYTVCHMIIALVTIAVE